MAIFDSFDMPNTLLSGKVAEDSNVIHSWAAAVRRLDASYE